MNPDTEAKLKRAFRDHAPAFVFVKYADDETRELAPGKNARSRWAPILEALKSEPWVSAELRDAKGKTIGATIRNDGAAADLETLSSGAPSGAVSARVAETAQLFGLAATHTRHMVDLNHSQTAPVFAVMQKTLDQAVGLNEHLREELGRERKQREKAEARADVLAEQVEKIVAAAAKAKAEGADANGVLAQLVEVTKALPQILPAVRGLLAGLSPSTPKPVVKVA